MADKPEVLDFARRHPKMASILGRGSAEAEGEAVAEKHEAPAAEEDSCPAFGYLRGLHERGVALELRFRNGDHEFFAYSCLVSFRHNPSAGLLLKFTGDVVTLVLIRGSNLDAMVNNGAVNLTDRGLQRHRITWIGEMDEDAIRKAGGQPTIDKFEVGEFESAEAQTEWLE